MELVICTQDEVFFPLLSASFILSPGLQIPGMSAQRQKTEIKSSWAKRGPDNKTNLVFTCFPSILPSVLAILNHTPLNTQRKMGVFDLVFHWKRPEQAFKLEAKRTELYIYTNLILFIWIYNLQAADLLLCMHRLKIKKGQSRSSAVPRPLTFQLCASQRFPVDTRTRAEGLKVTTD